MFRRPRRHFRNQRHIRRDRRPRTIAVIRTITSRKWTAEPEDVAKQESDVVHKPITKWSATLKVDGAFVMKAAISLLFRQQIQRPRRSPMPNMPQPCLRLVLSGWEQSEQLQGPRKQASRLQIRAGSILMIASYIEDPFIDRLSSRPREPGPEGQWTPSTASISSELLSHFFETEPLVNSPAVPR